MPKQDEILAQVLAQQAPDEKIVVYADSKDETPIIRGALRLSMLKKQKGLIVVSNKAFYIIGQKAIMLKIPLGEIRATENRAKMTTLYDFAIKTEAKNYNFDIYSKQDRTKAKAVGWSVFGGIIGAVGGLAAAGSAINIEAINCLTEMLKAAEGKPSKGFKLARIELA